MATTAEQRKRKLEKAAEYREKNREQLRLKAAEYNNKPEVLERRKAQRESKAEDNRAKAKAWYEANKDRAKESSRRFKLRRRHENPERYREEYSEYNSRPEVKERRKKYRTDNRERENSRCSAWYSSNKDRHKRGVIKYRSTEKGRAAALANCRHRQATKTRSVPPFANRAAIRAVYRKARELSKTLGVKLVVDHVIPLRSPLVCGLHCESNLQLLADDLNVAKSNSFHSDW